MAPDGWLGWSAFALLMAAWASAVVVVGARRRTVAPPLPDAAQVPASPPAFRLGQAPFDGLPLDLAAELRGVLEDSVPEARQHHVQLEQAVPPHVMVHADRQALRSILTGLVHHAVVQVPGGHVLVTAQRRGGRVQLAVSDDGVASAVALRQAALRDVTQLVALHGGTLEIEPLSHCGTTVVVWLPEAPPRRQARSLAAPTIAAASADSPALRGNLLPVSDA